MTDLSKTVESLLEKAAAAAESTDALRFSQAALNAAHTRHALMEPLPPKDDK